jgi:hypothetical protein
MMIKVELGFWEFWETKLGQTNSNFYSWINSSCLTKAREHGMPILMTKDCLQTEQKQHIQTWCPYLARLEVVPGLGA